MLNRISRTKGKQLTIFFLLFAFFFATLLFLVDNTKDVPAPAVRTLNQYSSGNVDTPAYSIAATWVGYGPGWRDGYKHSFSGYHMLKIEGGDVVPAISIDHSRQFTPKLVGFTAQVNLDVHKADAALWLMQSAGYEAPVPVDANTEAAAMQMAAWRLTDGLKIARPDLSKEHIDAQPDLLKLINGLVKVTEDSSTEYSSLPPASFWIVGSSERKPNGSVELTAVLESDRNAMPNQSIEFKYPGGSVIAETDKEGRAGVEVPILAKNALRARILWRGIAKAGTIFVCVCPGNAKSQTLMTIRDAKIERSVVVPINEVTSK